ncbi:MAG: DUF3575 domain-containing protein [Paludibacteraceae bacterium]|nr:DUF3575 domain-containing protein [Paludibacteraceae bacterium]
MKIKDFAARSILAGLFLLCTVAAYAERDNTEIIAIKNNLLYDATLTPNIEVEFNLHPHWSIELGGSLNPFPLKDSQYPKWRHFAVWAAPRYWFCHTFNRGFISANVTYAHYNVAGKAWPVEWMYTEILSRRYQGDAVMGGLSGGWHFPIASFFSIELEAGISAGYSWYDEFECVQCGFQTGHGGRWLILPKIGVNIAFPIGGDQFTMSRRRWRLRSDGSYCSCP